MIYINEYVGLRQNMELHVVIVIHTSSRYLPAWTVVCMES